MNTGAHRAFFRVLTSSDATQAAMMVLKPGQATGEKKENEHPRSEQWLCVISGTGRARVGRRSARLNEGSLLLVERNERHQIENTGRRPLVTLNFYAPPAYTREGDVRLRAKGLAGIVADAIGGE